MIPNFSNHDRPRKRRRFASHKRRGYVALLGIMLITIGVATLILIVDWTFLVFASRRTLQLSDTLALSAVAELIDEDRLEDLPLNQSDDEVAANFVITDGTTGFLTRNNAALGSQFQPTASDLTIHPARVENTASDVSGGNFTLTPSSGERFNSLRVEINRDPNGLNPLYLLMRGFGAPETAKITSSSIATLDSRVVGYRPRTKTPSPVAPIAILRDAWEIDRLSEPPNGNNRRELDVVLKFSDGTDPGDVNAALVNVDSTGGGLPAVVTLQDQIETGLYPTDVNPATGVLGPFTSHTTNTLYAEDQSPAHSDINALVSSFLNVKLSKDPRRVFLLYDSATFPGHIQITGFIAANIIDADAQPMGMSGVYRLRIRLEPEAIVHFTAETSYLDTTLNIVPENDYCHKIRLTR